MNIERFASLIRMLASDNDNEVVAAARAMQQVLKADKRDLNDLAEWCEKTMRGPITIHRRVVIIQRSAKQQQKYDYENSKVDKRV